ncbi:mitochondrial inner membrane protease subunit 2 [Agrilus planipennis]|uniref:Mitochondrial inner membrane protease subunit n=1 Tax=Agrilus planipennis TaxID=224129 RepID=A0A1W4X716_AGRPL|nr:mitochondrial inner membrane protease subunit 2 [Agrilus planipennis]
MFLFYFIKKLSIAVPVTITFFDVVGYIARVDGISMQPTLNPDKGDFDYIFLNRWSVRFNNIRRGDIVCIVSPKDLKQSIVKRVVGLQGDVISTMSYEKTVLRVPEGHCWVEGDHVGHSFDSNNFGPISLGLITAKASCIVWPPSRWQFIYPYLSRKPLNAAL